MEKGLRRALLVDIADAFMTRGFFAAVLLQNPSIPFPTSDKCPTLFIPVVPGEIRDETNNDRQSDFRFAPTALVYNNDGTLDLDKLDAIDEIEECLLNLGRDNAFISKYSLMTVSRYDTTPLSLAPWGITSVQILPPYGAVRFDCSVDFHYQAVTA